MKKKAQCLLAFLLALIMSFMGGCTPNDIEPSVTTTDTKEPLEKDLFLIKDGKSDYVIVIPQGGKKYVRQTANLFSETIQTLTGVVIPVRDDSEGESGGAEQEKEILFGITNRAEQAEMDLSCFAEGYEIAVKNQKLIVSAQTQGGLYLAVQRFVLDQFNVEITAEIPSGEKSSWSLPRIYRCVQNLPFSLFPYFDIDGSNYRVVYQEDDFVTKRFAARVSQVMEKLSGKKLAIVNDGMQNENLINLIVEKTDGLGDGNFRIEVNGKRMIFRASDYYGFEGLCGYLLEAAPNGYFPFRDGFSVSGNYRDSLSTLTSSTQYAFSGLGEVRVMSYNTLWGERPEERAVLQTEMLSVYMPDALGLQELSLENRAALIPKLVQIGYVEAFDYTLTNHPRGNPSPVFYNSATLSLVDSGWKIFESQKSNSEIRMMSWAVLQSKESGRLFAVLNSHLAGGNAVVGLGQIKEIEAQIRVLSAEYPNVPTFVLGDFNLVQTSVSYQYLVKNAGCIHARDLAITHTGSAKTTHHYPEYNYTLGIMQPGGDPGYDTQNNHSFDHIFLTDKVGTVHSFGVVVDECTRSGSDHFPVFSDYSFAE